MSGGSLDYFYGRLEEHVGDFGDRELDELVKDMANLFYEREWYLSGDTCVGEWNEARDAFKDKWFTEYGREKRIENYLTEIGNEIRESLTTKHRYCQFCKHWTPAGERYGKCGFEARCLMHRSETCEKWEGR